MNIYTKLGASKYQELIRECILNEGNNSRLKAAIEKDTIRIAFLGGSVTMGVQDSGMIKEAFPYLLGEGLKPVYRDKLIDVLNLGFPAVNSIYGLFQTERNLIDYSPDIVFVEYGVNDGASLEWINAFESLIRKLLQLPSKPVVGIILLMLQTLQTRRDYMLELGRFYWLPVIGIYEAFPEYMKRGELNWNDYSNDEAHANREGHEFICDCLYQLIMDMTDKETDTYYEMNSNCLYGAFFTELKLLDFYDKGSWEGTFLPVFSQSNEFALENDCKAWEHFFRFHARCKGIIVIYEQSSQKSYGTAQVIIDGSERFRLKGHSIYGWNNPVCQILLGSDIAYEHTVEIRMIKSEERKIFKLLYLGWC